MTLKAKLENLELIKQGKTVLVCCVRDCKRKHFLMLQSEGQFMGTMMLVKNFDELNTIPLVFCSKHKYLKNISNDDLTPKQKHMLGYDKI